MALSVGIVGMPNVGKSTLLNLLANAGAQAENYPFCTIDRNIGVVEVPDDKLVQLCKRLSPAECIPSSIEIVDIAGLVKGASRGEGLGNKFLGHIREVDAIAHVVRCFGDPDVVHIDGSVDPLRDIDIVNTELALADLESAGKTLEKERKVHTDESKKRVAVLEKIVAGLDSGKQIRELGLSDDETDLVRDHNFLTAKPMLYVSNIGETDFHDIPDMVKDIREKYPKDRIILINVKLEIELAELPAEDRRDFMDEIGLAQPALLGLVREFFDLLMLINFYTVANNKLRAWKVRKGTKAPKAAGLIHSDMETGFIRAEIATVEDLVESGSFPDLRKIGKVRSEGKDYEIQSEDVVHFLFSSI